MKAEVVFCDDIRTEANGKLILIGVYPNDLVPAVIPQTVAIALMIRLFDFGESVPKFAHLTLIPPGGGQKVEVDMPAPNIVGEFRPHDPLLMILGGLPLELRGYGEVIVELSLEGGKAERVAVLPIRGRDRPS